jgi:hypothetical protein
MSRSVRTVEQIIYPNSADRELATRRAKLGPRAERNLEVSREQFLKKAEVLVLTVQGTPAKPLSPKAFAPSAKDGKRSFGWNAAFKAYVEVNGVPLYCQVNCNVIVIGSRDMP